MDFRFPTTSPRSRWRCMWFVAALVGAVVVLFGPGVERTSAQGTVPSLPEWLEPRGISIVDFVGQVPEDQLRDMAISYEVGTGMVRYVSGERNDDTVRISTRITPRYGTGYGTSWTTLGCLGQWAAFDQWPAAVPASTMQLYSGGKEITSRIVELRYVRTGLVQPSRGSDDGARNRYPLITIPRPANDPMQVPANMGCEIVVEGIHRDPLTAVFTMKAPQRLFIQYTGYQTWRAQSYVGVGFSGALSGLAGQMNSRFGHRHDRFTILAPAGADIMLFKYPPTPYDPAVGQEPANANLPGSGTYRLERWTGGLSVDHHNTMGLPIYGQWQDADQADGDFLPFIFPTVRISAPEYFLPPGVPYDPCMTPGTCPGEVLDRVYEASYNVTAYYYSVMPLEGAPVWRVPLRQVGKSWSSSAAVLAAAETGFRASDAASEYVMFSEQSSSPTGALPDQEGNMVWLPLVSKPPRAVFEDRTGCPCGWFDVQGRMFDFIPPPL